MKLLKLYISDFFKSYDDNIKVNVLGRVNDLPKDLQSEINKAIDRTKNNTGLVLNICFNYGGRDEIVTATKKIAEDVLSGKIKIEDIDETMVSNNLYTAGQPDPDLLIRTSGEERLSNFLLWQNSYAEFIFDETYFPDFNEEEFDKCINEYYNRDRRFGGVKNK